MAGQPDINDSFELEGLWWVPDQPEVRLPGKLSFSQRDGPTLTLFGSFSTDRSFGADLQDQAVIHGIVKDGQEVSLLDVLHTSHQGALTHDVVQEVYAGHILATGYHFSSDDEEIFERSFVSFEDIEEWLGHRFFHFGSNDDVSFKLSIDRFTDRPLAQIDGISISSGTSFYTNDGTTDFSIKASCHVKIIPEFLKSLRWHLEAAIKIQSLASLCTGRHLPLRSLVLNGPKVHFSSEWSRPANVHLYASFPNPGSQKSRRHETPLVRVADFPNPADQVFQQWFECYETLSPALHLFLATLADRGTYISARFTLAVQALEVFHRKTAASAIISANEHAALQKALISAIPNGTSRAMREKLKGLLSFSNEPSLRQRLRALLKEIEESFDEKPAGYEKSFVSRLVDTRNYYTHYSPELEDRALEGLEMHYAIRRIVLLLTVLLLVRIGIEPTKLRKAIGSHREFRQLWDNEGNPA